MLRPKLVRRITPAAALAFVILCLGCARETPIRTIAIATLMSHPALDAVATGMKEELESSGLRVGREIQYVERNANGQVQLAAQIADDLAAINPSVVVAITTPMAQAAVAKIKSPIVFAAVTDPVSAGLVRSMEVGQSGVTGTSDAWPYEDQLRLIRRITPGVKRIGLIFNPGESAAAYGVAQFRKLAPDMNFELVEGAVSSTTDVYPVAQSLAGRSDALLIGSDNTVISGVASAIKAAVERQIPLYVGDSGTVEKGGLATVSVGYLQLGRETGKLVARILAGETTLPTVVGHGSEIYLNRKAAELMGVKIPEDVVRDATKVYDEIKQ